MSNENKAIETTIEQNIKKIDGKDLAYFEPFYLKEFVAAPSHIKGLN